MTPVPTRRRKGRLWGLIVPNSATLLEDEAQGRSSPVLDALHKLKVGLADQKIDAVISISPFWIPEHTFCVDTASHHRSTGDYHGYSVEVKYQCPGDPELAQALLEEGRRAGLPVTARHHGADHSSSVSLHFLYPKGNIPLVPVSAAELSLKKCWAWGECIRRTVERSGKTVLFFSSGGLSHNLTACLHWEDTLAAVIFDQKVLKCLRTGRGSEVVKMDRYWIEMGNPPSRFHDLFIFLGAVGRRRKGRLAAYDGGPGVGWAVVGF